MTPDWDVKPVTVPYAKFGDPQTLNLYAYVENSPINQADADGHCAEPFFSLGPCNGAQSPAPNSGTGAAGASASPDAVHTISESVPLPLTPKQIQKKFYKEHGKALNAAVTKVFGKDAPKQQQTLANAPKLDTSKTRAELGKMSGNPGELDESRNRPNSNTYQAKDGTIFIAKETVAGGRTNVVSGDYAHELGNLLDVQVNGFTNFEKNYGDPNYVDPATKQHDPDSGAQVEINTFGSTQY